MSNKKYNYEYSHSLRGAVIEFKATRIEELVLAMADANMVFTDKRAFDWLIEGEVSYKENKKVKGVKYLYLYEGSTVISYIDNADCFSLRRVGSPFMLDRISKI